MTRVFAIVGVVLVVGGVAVRVFVAVTDAATTSAGGEVRQLAIVVGLVLLIAAWVIWLVRSRRNRLAHPIAVEAGDQAEGASVLS